MSVVKAMTRTISVGAPGLPLRDSRERLTARDWRPVERLTGHQFTPRTDVSKRMAGSAGQQKLTGIAARFGAFVAERHPLALAGALDALEAVARGHAPTHPTRLGAATPAVLPGSLRGLPNGPGS